MIEPLFLIRFLQSLGAGSQVIVAASVGIGVWYLYRVMGIGRLVGAVTGQALRYVLAVGAAGALGIAFGWVNPGALGSDLSAAGNVVGQAIGRWGDDIVRGLMEVLQG